MKYVHKYNLPVGCGPSTEFDVWMAEDAEVLSFGLDPQNRFAIWVRESAVEAHQKRPRRFNQCWTGQEVPGHAVFRGTVRIDTLMYHLFEYTR